jgi:hypothetical protein
MADTSEPISDIAGVGAEFPMAVAVDGEYLPAGRASKGVDCLPLHQLQMCIPPLVPAGITAEPFPLPPRILSNGLSAILTDCPVCSGCQTVPPAKRLHRVDGNLELHRYPAIPGPSSAQSNNLLFLFVRHDGYLLNFWSSGVTGQNGYY